jgi:CheY-like chemotaxis protein
MKTILIVDDNPDLLTCLKHLLAHFGYRAIPAQDAGSALAVIHSGLAVDLIITDYRMPGMNGLELTEILKESVPSTPIIMFSASPSTNIYKQAQALGIVEYVKKPVSPHELKLIVERALSQSLRIASENPG